MALKLGELTVKIGADTFELQRAEKKVKQSTDRMGGAFRKLGGIIAVALSFEAVKRVVLLADGMKLLDARIKNLTNTAKDFQVIRKGIRDIAKETGGSIQSIGTLAQSLLIAGESIGATSDEVVEMTSNLQKLGAIGGTSSEAMSNAMLQFGQAMAGGVVRAEEFNSIVENTPLIAKQIADGMGVTTGELRKMVIEGRVLSEDVFESLKGQTDDINKKFEAMPLSVDRATGMIANSFAVAVQEIDQGLGITETIAEAMSDVADIISEDLVPFVDNLVDGFQDFLFFLDNSVASAEQLGVESVDLGKSWELITGWVSRFFTAMKELPANIADVITVIIGEFDQLFINIVSNAKITWEVVKTSFLIVWDQMLASAEKAWLDFSSVINQAAAALASAVGADDIAEQLRLTAVGLSDASRMVTEQLGEDLIIRLEFLELEKAELLAKAEVELAASQSSIDAGLSITESMKKQAKERSKIRKKERADIRRTAKAETGKVDTIKKVGNSEVDYKKTKAEKEEALFISSVGKIFGIEKAAAIASATLGLGQAISKALAAKGTLGFGDVAVLISAFSNVVSSINSARSPGRQFGGIVSGGSAVPVNEGSSPEMFVNNAGRQFLIPDSQGNIVPLSGGGGGGMGGAGGMQVVINNNSSAEVSEPVISEGRLMFEINNAVDRAVSQVNGSLASGRGESSDAVRQGFALTRNI